MEKFFKPKSVAVVGVSRNKEKVGYVIFKSLLDSNFKGKIFPVNPKIDYILNKKCYKSVLEIKESIELTIIAIPANLTLKIIEECGKKKVKNIILISSGFSEIGNIRLEKDLKKIIKKHKIKLIGPNCLGIFDSYSNLDTLFLPISRLTRPKKGNISFICQSGAVGSATLDLIASKGFGFSKFVSYGNALDVNETDLLEYLGNDKKTKVICLYIEGVKSKNFIKIAKKVSKKKPIIAIKGGITKEGSEAVSSHTGSLAGNAEIYSGVFKQSGILEVNSLEELFNSARVLDKCIKPKGKKVQVITNGGGYGVLCADHLSMNNLILAKFSKKTRSILRKKFSPIVVLKNPIDLLGDADTEGYEFVIKNCLDDKNIDILLLVILYQTPLISPEIVDVVFKLNDLKKKPIVVVSTGGKFTEEHIKRLEEKDVPCFVYPENAVLAIKTLVDYHLK